MGQLTYITEDLIVDADDVKILRVMCYEETATKPAEHYVLVTVKSDGTSGFFNKELPCESRAEGLDRIDKLRALLNMNKSRRL